MNKKRFAKIHYFEYGKESQPKNARGTHLTDFIVETAKSWALENGFSGVRRGFF